MREQNIAGAFSHASPRGTDQACTSPSTQTLASDTYTLDPAGTRTGVSEGDGRSIAWRYDDADQLRPYR